MSDNNVLAKVILLLVVILIHVAAGDSEDRPVSVEGEACDGGGEPVELAQSLLVVAVPDVDEAVTPPSGEGVVLPVERYRVDGVYIFNSILLQTMTFERVFLLLSLWGRIKHLHRDSSLNAAEHVPSLVWEGPDAPCLVLEAALSLLGGHRHVPQVPDEDLPPRRGHHQALAGAGH